MLALYDFSRFFEVDTHLDLIVHKYFDKEFRMFVEYDGCASYDTYIPIQQLVICDIQKMFLSLHPDIESQNHDLTEIQEEKAYKEAFLNRADHQNFINSWHKFNIRVLKNHMFAWRKNYNLYDIPLVNHEYDEICKRYGYNRDTSTPMDYINCLIQLRKDYHFRKCADYTSIKKDIKILSC